MASSIQTYQRQADQQRRDELIVSHLPLVKHVIGRLVGGLPPGIDVENLESAGVLGLVEAAGKFYPTRNAGLLPGAFAAAFVSISPIVACGRSERLITA